MLRRLRLRSPHVRSKSVTSQGRSADQLDGVAETARRDARDARELSEVGADSARRDARDARELSEVAADSARRDARDAQERVDNVQRQLREQRQEQQNQQVQRLESVGQLAGGIAHDFNNLLSVILYYTSFVSEELLVATESDWPERLESARTDLGQITLAANRAASLTRQLLAFARQEVIRPRVLDLNNVIFGVEEMLRRTIGEHIELVASLHDGLWPVLADPGQLEQVLVNLAVNARDAMAGGGVLTIDTCNIYLDSEIIAGGSGARQGRHVRLRISDTGSGMSPDVAEHVFEPFFTTKEKGAGTGLGLATVYGIVAQADGHIQIYSEPGIGTTVTIMVPVTTQAVTMGAEPLVDEHTPKGETILIVEDEQALREVTKRILTRRGYRVISAANGPEALNIASEHAGEIHLLVTDVVMPQMLGKVVAERMKVLKPGIEVLFMSGYARPVLDSQGRLDPNVALVEKPFSEAELLEKVGQALNGFSLRSLRDGEKG